MVSEKDLIKGCQRGKAKFQRLLYELYAPKMLGVCMRYFHSKSEAQDALQDGFVKVYTKIHNFRSNGSLEGWIRRIMVNTSLNLLRDNLKHLYHSDVDDEKVHIADSSVEYDQFNVQDILKLIQGMPSGYQIIFNLYEIDGYAHKEIAEEMQISVNTSKSQLLKARKYLQNELAKLNKETN